ncbi:MAG: DUF434 domain-containing protein, partial [Thermoanaerobaculia bacterium]|nr:DUF434 domain-containing protein [Thermoanaerobaculia bacterium]
MPDTRVHRGAHPRDAECFAPGALPAVRAAVGDLSWLLGRGYPPRAAAKLVGDRYGLRDRQRKAVQRSAAAPADCEARGQRRVDAAGLRRQPLLVDGYNVLLTVEAALSGGVLLRCRDSVLRDLTAMSRHYRRVRTTVQALEVLGGFCREVGSERW